MRTLAGPLQAQGHLPQIEQSLEQLTGERDSRATRATVELRSRRLRLFETVEGQLQHATVEPTV